MLLWMGVEGEGEGGGEGDLGGEEGRGWMRDCE